MEAPKCKICDERHYGLCVAIGAHYKPAPKVIETITAPGSHVVFKKALISVTQAELVNEITAMAAKQVAKFDRIAYQREYMRKRRAAAKAK